MTSKARSQPKRQAKIHVTPKVERVHTGYDAGTSPMTCSPLKTDDSHLDFAKLIDAQNKQEY